MSINARKELYIKNSPSPSENKNGANDIKTNPQRMSGQAHCDKQQSPQQISEKSLLIAN